MLSKESNAGSRPLHRERNLIDQGLLSRGWSWQWGGEKLSVNSYCIGLRGPIGLSRWGLEAAFCNFSISSRKAALAIKKEVNCC